MLFSQSINKFYIGSTISFQKRISEHNTAAFGSTKFTASTSDWEEFILISCESIEQARRIENHIKRMKSSVYIRNLKIFTEMIVKLKSKYLTD